MTVLAHGDAAADQPVSRMEITRRTPGPHKVQMKIPYCGIYHSDLHQARSEWAGTLYPCVPGSMIGGIPETQEMLNFCAEHGIVADIEMIRADEIETAYERMLKGDVKYRFVMDIASMAG
ncbi:NAD(P)-dependent alcohol dehydrogenase (plasmid) [Paracoccus yeei]|uniref:NAD(P)-dependent alcohol dehydrogenase n=1 Tax=Paracoccus yeei TaxID=147645 RepID=A0A386UR59_9RHOB|nr:hypothetical protein [Paracoccus yeei]AYF03255.1 NAD(P)-dependent alcohol dehydrogenase [Paracoccus yeei]